MGYGIGGGLAPGKDNSFILFLILILLLMGGGFGGGYLGADK